MTGKTDHMHGNLAKPTSRVDNVIDLEKVHVAFGEGKNQVTALAETSLRIDHGEFVALVGPSGCGKSTILKLVAGTLAATQGHVFVAGREVGASPVRIGMAFQNPTLLPWLTVRDNVMLPLKIVPPFKQAFSEKRKTEYRDRVEASLTQVGLGGFGDKFPWQLSGGMQQRVSIARALSFDPHLLLMDEPFGALDEIVRDHLNEQLLQLWDKTKKTVLFVTHSIPEAVFLSTRIVVMSPRPGRIIDIIDCDFPRQRTLEIRETPEFLKIAQRVRVGLRAGHSYDE
jgi:NitT/TauT family transport system ATP-binding protein